MNRNQFMRITGGSGLILAAAPLVGFSSQEVEQLDKKGVEEFIDFSRKKGILGKCLFKNCSVQCRNGGRY